MAIILVSAIVLKTLCCCSEVKARENITLIMHQPPAFNWICGESEKEGEKVVKARQ